MLVHYDRARQALSAALASPRVDMVLASRSELDHIKLRARQIRDRALLADATEFQMRIERHLGTLLLVARGAGQLHVGGRPAKANAGDLPPALLRDIGVSKKLSMKAQALAGLDPQIFDAAIVDMRERMAISTAKSISVGAIEKNRGGKKAGSLTGESSSFRFLLVDGIPLGQVRLGKLRTRIDRLALEIRILSAISDRVGAGSEPLASIEDSISEAMLAQMISAAKEASV